MLKLLNGVAKLLVLSLALAGCDVALWDGHDQIFLGHQIVLGDKVGEAQAQKCLLLELVEYPAVMEIGVREDAIHATTHRAEL